MKIRVWTLLCALLLANTSQAQDDASCNTIRFAMLDWADLKVTSTASRVLLEKLGYQVELDVKPSIGEVYESLANDQNDLFLGNWMPANTDMITPYLEQGQLEVLQTNLKRGLYTIAVPEYVYDQGVTRVQDLGKYAAQFGGRVYGLEKGNTGNALVKKMIANPAMGMSQLELIPTSERLMLAQANGRIRKGQWVAFLGWIPHPMNRNFELRYLDGADDYFGPDKGASYVRTVAQDGFSQRCPNAARLMKNMVFSQDMEELLMDQIMNGFVPPLRAVRIWMHDNEATVTGWLQGVATRTGGQPDSRQIVADLEVGWGRLTD